MGPVYVLIAITVGAGTAGVVWSVRRRLWELPLYVGGALAGCAVATAVGSPWIDAKALAITSPAVVIAGMSGAAWLFQGGRRTEAAVVAAAIAGGVLWSNALAYHDAWLAPRGQLRELQQIGKRFAGEGPTLMTEYQPYGVRHFLRDMDPESPAELRRRPIPLRNGQLLPKGQYRDVDAFELDGILVYRTLVLPHSPSASRPPSVYRLAWGGRFYDVWQRSTGGARILEHLPLGSGNQAVATPNCRAVLRLARLAVQNDGSVAAFVRPRATIVRDAAPAGSWRKVRAAFALSRQGSYGIWLAGMFRRQVEVWVDGRRIYRGRHQLIHEGIETLLAELTLGPGKHDLVVHYGDANLRPGSGGGPFALGPISVSRATDGVPVTYVDPADARSLCGKSLDWIEAIGR
jgi:hypothetical protein